MRKLGVGAESDDEIRRVPDFGGELPAGASTSGREVSSAGVGDRIQVASAEAGQQRKRGRDPADKEHKRLKRCEKERPGIGFIPGIHQQVLSFGLTD